MTAGADRVGGLRKQQQTADGPTEVSPYKAHHAKQLVGIWRDAAATICTADREGENSGVVA